MVALKITIETPLNSCVYQFYAKLTLIRGMVIQEITMEMDV